MERKEKKVSKTLNDQESEIESLKKTLTEERESHARTCFSRDDMMNSLSENQKLLSSHQSTIEHQVIMFLFLQVYCMGFKNFQLIILVHFARLDITALVNNVSVGRN